MILYDVDLEAIANILVMAAADGSYEATRATLTDEMMARVVVYSEDTACFRVATMAAFAERMN
jgi:hypothetical protein